MRRSLWLAAAGLGAFALSWLYVHFYLRGGPRIIDATSYFLEARSIAAGSFQFQVPSPSGSFRGRFLLASDDGQRLGVIFPPGYPALLALGFLLRAPLLVGPLLGAALVVATYFLARAATGREDAARLAAALSVTSAALRYHTADTMSHGLSALLLVAALALSLQPLASQRALPSLGAGLLVGWLFATRPVSGAVALVLCAVALRARGSRALGLLLGGLLPGVLLLLWHQRALTGDLFGSTQLAYYAAADAPPGCFRYGFGAGVGCRFEHGSFVERFLPHGYGLLAALRNVFVRFALFSVDATNAAPLSLLAAFAVYRRVRSPLGLLGAGVVLQGLAYAPFYFDGNYPGGGARFLCEAIPLCQVLVASAALELRLGRFVLPASLAGFLLHARFGHEQLRDRDGGRPMFEPALLAAAGVTRGLVFVSTDHGFNLGFDPALATPARGLVVARLRGDAHDFELYERLGRPPTYRYRFAVERGGPPTLASYRPAASAVYEAEAEWPPVAVAGGAYPLFYPCASGGAGLRLYAGTRVSLEIPQRLPLERPEASPAIAAGSALEIGWLSTRAGRSRVAVAVGLAPAHELSAIGPGCHFWSLPAAPGSFDRVQVQLLEGEGAVDFVRLGKP